MRQTAPCQLLFGAFHYGKQQTSVGAEDSSLKNCRELVRALCLDKAAKATLFVNGSLLESIERHCHATSTTLRQLVKEQRLELLGASFYDSQLALLPALSRSAHIERMTSQLSRMVRKRPQGFWLEEGIWDPTFPVPLEKAAIRYVFLPSKQLKRDSAPRLFSPFITEEQGKSIFILPLHGSEILPHPSSFVEAEELLRRMLHLQRRLTHRHESTPACISCFVDGQNPRYDYHWYLSFFDLLKRTGWALQLPASYLKEHNQQQRSAPLFFPSSSSVGDIHPAPCRNEHANYRQLFNLHHASRLLLNRFHYTQLLANQMRGDKQRRKEAFHLLWLGCSHRAYLPSGLPDPEKRQWCYQQFIRCERLCQKHIKSPLTTIDYNNDGADEYVFRGKNHNAVVQQQGGTLLEWEDLIGERSYCSLFNEFSLPATGSFLDSITLRHQHGQALDSSHHSLSIHRDLAGQHYRLESQRVHAPQLCFTTTVSLPEIHESSLIRKEYNFTEDLIQVEYHLTRLNYQKDHQLLFTTEFNLCVTADTVFHIDDQHGQHFSGKVSNQIEMSSLSSLNLAAPNARSRLSLHFSQPLNIRCQPLYTLSGSHIHFQGIRLRVQWLVEADWIHRGILSIGARTSPHSRNEPVLVGKQSTQSIPSPR